VRTLSGKILLDIRFTGCYNTNIPVNKINRKKKKRKRPIKVDKGEYKKKSIVERLVSWIKSCK